MHVHKEHDFDEHDVQIASHLHALTLKDPKHDNAQVRRGTADHALMLSKGTVVVIALRWPVGRAHAASQ